MFINRHLIAFAKKSYKQIGFTCLLSIILTEISTGVLLCTAMIIRMILGEEIHYIQCSLQGLFIALFIMIVIRFFISKYKLECGAKCGLRIKEILRKKMLNKLFQLGAAYTSDENTGSIATTIFNKVEWLGNYYTIYIPTAISAIINAILIFIFLIYMSPMISVVCFIATIGILACPMCFYKIMSERGRLEWEAEEEYYEDCLDGIQGIVTLKAFNADALQKDKIHQGGEKLRKTVMGQLKITMIENGVLEFFGRLGSAFSIALAAFLVYQGKMDGELLVYALFLIGACFTPMLNLIPAWHMGYRGITASEGIVQLLHSQSKYFTDKDKRKANDDNILPEDRKDIVSDFTGDVVFENVSFAYDEANGEVLHNVNITMQNKTTTALVGPSGSGKSTIANILAGFYEVNKGMVRLGNTKITANNIGEMQKMISVVWQEGHLFYGTVIDNIKIGNPEATYEEVVEAAQAANIHEFIINLPSGYETHLGEDGMRFSGGERQRIAIARAFLRNTPILILDEATSSLDRKNEIEIQKSIGELSRGKTVLVIAHRLATIQNANQICILDDGKIQDIGTHDELRKTSKLYQKLMGKQLMGEMAGEGR